MPDIKKAIQYAKDTMRSLGSILGLSLPELDVHDPAWSDKSIVNILKDVEIEDMIKKRTQLRKEKKYKEADAVRKELEEKGVILEDKKGGTTEWEWKR